MEHMEPSNDEEQVSWLWDNLFLIILNLIFGLVSCVLIWICTRAPEKELPKKESRSEDKKRAKEPSHDDKKVAVEEVVEDCKVEEVHSVESTDEDHLNKLDQHDEITTEITIQEVVEDIKIEEVADLHHEDEDLMDHHDADGTIEVPSRAKIEVSDSNGEEYVVIKSTDTKETTVETVESISGTTTYEIDVITGDVSGAGTDANVFIIIYGETCDTGKIHLEKSSTHHSKFERNHVDSFSEEALNVGKISKIRIGHNDKGSFAGWYLANVVIHVPSLNCKWTFPADRWLDKREDDKQIEIDVYPTLVVETYEETIYEEGKLEDLVLKSGDATVSHEESESDGVKTTVSHSTDTKIGSHNETIVEEITVTTSEEVHTATVNVTTGEDIHIDRDTHNVAVEAIVDHNKYVIENRETSADLMDDTKGISD